MSAPPATPQRTATHSHSQSVSVSLPHGFSPSSPYTPLSLRSFASASPSSGSLNPSPSSTLATPASIKNINVNAAFSSPPVVRTKRISWASPSPSIAHHGHAHHESLPSIADLKQNWRSRANENGIKVSQANAKMSLGDDSSFMDDADSSLISEHGFGDNEALLPPPFLSTQRRRALSHAASLPSSSPPASMQASSLQNNVTHSAPHPRVRAPLAPLSPVTRRNVPVSPVQVRRANAISQQSIMATPPPNRNLAERLRLKGSFTDPAKPRQREVFATAPLASDVSFDRDLFDIHEDENDYQYELEYDSYHELRDYYQPDHHGACARETQSDIEEEQFEVEYPSLPPQQQQYQDYHYQQQHHLHSQKQAYSALPPAYSHPPGLIHPHTLAQPHGPAYPPGLGLPLFAQGQTHQMQYAYGSQMQQSCQLGQLAPTHVPLPMTMQSVHQPQGPPSIPSDTVSLPAPSPTPLLHSESPVASAASPSVPAPSQSEDSPSAPHPKSCSICARRPPSLARLAVLTPCGHALCPACLTSALNIVGEKDMECAMCRGKVADFKLISISADGPGESKGPSNKDGNGTKKQTKIHGDSSAAAKRHPLVSVDINSEQARHSKDRGKSFFDPLFSSPGSTSGVEKAFEVGFDLFDGADMAGFRASTPPPKVSRKAQATSLNDLREGTKADPVVLRIDNVPWDITPPRIVHWLRQPVVRVHVLLDRKGKTMSHAFVEVEDEEIAGKVLRGEAYTGGFRGSVLGKGRRARGVTITRSSQGELMTALFPSWLGTFDRCRPSLAGLDSARVIASLESGLMTESEVASLLFLIRSPDAHFLKVPSLPFHSLISILSKFPTDVDSRVFWSSSLRDVLFDVAFAAIQVLAARVEKQAEEGRGTDGEYPPTLVDELVNVTSTCQAFTAQQTAKVLDFFRTKKAGKNDDTGSASAPHSRTVSATGSVSSSSSRFETSGADPTDADVEDEDGEEETDDKRAGRRRRRTSGTAFSEDDDEVRTSSSATAAASIASSSDGREAAINSHAEGISQAVPPTQNDNSQQALGDLAREFGVEAQLVQALAQRLGMAQI